MLRNLITLCLIHTAVAFDCYLSICQTQPNGIWNFKSGICDSLATWKESCESARAGTSDNAILTFNMGQAWTLAFKGGPECSSVHIKTAWHCQWGNHGLLPAGCKSRIGQNFMEYHHGDCNSTGAALKEICHNDGCDTLSYGNDLNWTRRAKSLSMRRDEPFVQVGSYVAGSACIFAALFLMMKSITMNKIRSTFL